MVPKEVKDQKILLHDSTRMGDLLPSHLSQPRKKLHDKTLWKPRIDLMRSWKTRWLTSDVVWSFWDLELRSLWWRRLLGRHRIQARARDILLLALRMSQFILLSFVPCTFVTTSSGCFVLFVFFNWNGLSNFFKKKYIFHLSYWFHSYLFPTGEVDVITFFQEI